PRAYQYIPSSDHLAHTKARRGGGVVSRSFRNDELNARVADANATRPIAPDSSLIAATKRLGTIRGRRFFSVWGAKPVKATMASQFLLPQFSLPLAAWFALPLEAARLAFESQRL